MKQVALQPAYVLHRRAYRETSFLVELFTPEHGRITVVAKGVRKPRSSMQGLLQPFIPLSVSWVGRGDLMTLTQVEVNGRANYLQGECLFAGFYLNELLMSLLQRWDAHPGVFTVYANAIEQLQGVVLEQKILRSFEKYLIEELGYGLLPKSDFALQKTFSADKYYRFIPDQGFVLCEAMAANVFSGKNLIAIAKEDWRDDTVLSDAKRLTRFVLAPLLGARPIYSRRLFLLPDERMKHEE